MRKMFQYRLFPTKKQVTKLNNTLEECRWLYNHLLEKRKDVYEQTGKGLTLYAQQSTFPILKTERPSLDTVHSQVLQNVAVRVDLAMKAFFRRCKEHAEKPGFPASKAVGAMIVSRFLRVALASPTITACASQRLAALR